MIRRILSCAGVMLVLLTCACARNTDTGGVTDLLAVPTMSSPIVGFSQLGEESEWRMLNTESILKAAEDAGVQVMYDNGQQKVENQIKALRSFIAYQVDAIVLAPLVETGWESVLQEARDAGIPVILEDREVADAPDGSVVAWVGSDFYNEGRKAGAYVLSAFKDQEGPVNIIELSGTAGSTAAQDRHDGFRDALGSRSRYRIIKSVSGDFMLSKGREVIRELLNEIDLESVNVLFSHNDDMTLGAIEVMEEMGIVPGRDIYIVTVDAQGEMLDLVRDGTVNCAVECNPDIGGEVFDVVRRVLDGEAVPSRTYSAEGVFTRKSLLQAEASPGEVQGSGLGAAATPYSSATAVSRQHRYRARFTHSTAWTGHAVRCEALSRAARSGPLA